MKRPYNCVSLSAGLENFGGSTYNNRIKEKEKRPFGVTAWKN